MFPANYSSRQNAGDLLADNRYLLPFDRQDVLFVYQTGIFVCRYQKFSFRVGQIGYVAGNRRAIDMHVQRRQEDADELW